MITQYTITGSSWTPISSAGQSGSCWLDEDNDGAIGKVDVRIVHGTSSPEAGDTTIGKRVYKPNGNDDLCFISADSPSDIYYAKCQNAGDQAIISVDVI